MTPAKNKRNLVLLSIFVFLFFTLLILTFFKIQIIEGDRWAQTARRQHFFVVAEPAKRGVFFSNTSIKKAHPEAPQQFVFDIKKYHLYIDPQSIPVKHHDEIAIQLKQKAGITEKEFQTFRENFDKKSRSRKLAMWLDQAVQEDIQEWWSDYAHRHKIPKNAVFFITDYQRSYPFGKLLGQVLHTVQDQKDEKTHCFIPTGGLELSCQKYLEGTPGKRRLMRSPRHSFETGDVIAEPKNGADVYLTINHTLQAIAEEELEKGVKKCNARCGWALMMDPYTGEILAFAQYPFFNPEEYQKFFNDPLLIEYTRAKAITDAYEPGSVIKPITLACAFIANEELKKLGKSAILEPSEKVETSKGNFPGRKPLTDTSLHYYLNMEMGVQKSSNIYMARLAEKIVNQLGSEWYRKTLHEKFGFGKRTTIELPGESPGVLPTPGKKHPNGALEWSVPTPFSLAMGHNIQTTSLQILRAHAVFANGGYLVQPTLIRKISKTDAQGNEELIVDNTSAKRIIQFPRVLSKEAVEKIVRAMKFTTKIGGTARRADIRGYTEAGKTGTANKISNGCYSSAFSCSTFVGFTPVKHPAFILLVTMDDLKYEFVPGIGKLHHGGAASAPVFREIGRRALEYLGVPQDDPHGFPAGDPRYDPQKADWIQETQRLKEMYEKWNNRPEKKT